MTTTSQDIDLPPFLQPRSSVVRVTPEQAARWLERNVGNRKTKPAKIAQYARDMAAGKWQITGEGIKFDTTGRLIDGQNRLHACIKSGAPFDTYVFLDLQPESQKVMDTGAARSASDSLTIGGERYATTIAAAARIALAIEAGAPIQSYGASHSEIEGFVEANPDIREAAAFASKNYSRTDCPLSVVTYTTWRLSRISQDAAQQFWRDANEKIGLTPGDPILALTNRFAEARRNRESVSHEGRISAVYRAWNARRSGRPLRSIRIQSSAGGTVSIPEPK